ncbi:hypothetical protein K443DRAFT_687144 [Laccaria amethystina LaAM-08-1]|uniref:Uncharacterized protein n=1 Tax=Laccaria amethystina LaAM-08-1 TaxID=1095629 RepID=A0A0C9WWT1_9AGAR|nr:hypothetical protein K443DRAFT_687144 [Laccaria amethystina LaAM-08-1]
MSYVSDAIASYAPEFRAQELNRFEFLAKRIACKGKIELVSEEREWWLDDRRRVGGIDGG